MKFLSFFLIPLFAFTSESLQAIPPQINFTKELTKMLWMLGLLIILFLVTVFIIKYVMNQKTFKLNAKSDIQIIQKRPLSVKTMLYIIEYEGKKILLSESSLEVKNLHQRKEQMPIQAFASLVDKDIDIDKE